MFWNNSSTAAGSLASHAYRRTPCDVSRAFRAGSVRGPRCDGDTHAVIGEQPGATRAYARTAPDDERNVFYGRLAVAFVGWNQVRVQYVCR